MKTAKLAGLGSVALLLSSTAYSAEYTGTIAMLEVWRNGNVAFTLSPAIPTCNTQVIINASDPGLKSLYAAVLAAKHADRAVRIATVACGQADNYGGSYNIPEFIYVQ